MEKVDYLIIGLGIAGLSFAKHCLDHGKSFKIITDQQNKASHIAAGMYNPIILFRFTAIHRAEEQMTELKQTFAEFESLLDKKLIYPKKIYRIFANQYEADIWKKKIPKKPILQQYLNSEVIPNTFNSIHAPFGFGEVMHSGWLDMSLLIDSFKEKFEDQIVYESFDYSELDIKDKIYKNIQAENIVFAEGVKVDHNPWFNYLPIIKSKGEILILKIEQELPDIIFKSKNFLMPIDNQIYYVGATYDKDFKTAEPTEENKELLLEKLATYYKGDYEVLAHLAAFRPTVIDRRSIIGEHPEIPGIFVLNGMGTRGSFNGPSLSKYLFQYIEFNKEIPEEYDVNRFNDLR